MSLKLLSAALQRQDYNLAAHILVYGLVKAAVKRTRNSANLLAPYDSHGSKRKRQAKG